MRLEACLYAAVLLTTCFGSIVGNRLGRAIALGRQTVAVNLELGNDVITDSVGPLLGQFDVCRFVTDIVSIAFDGAFQVLVLAQSLSNPVQFIVLLLLDHRLTGVEVYLERQTCTCLDNHRLAC